MVVYLLLKFLLLVWVARLQFFQNFYLHRSARKQCDNTSPAYICYYANNTCLRNFAISSALGSTFAGKNALELQKYNDSAFDTCSSHGSFWIFDFFLRLLFECSPSRLFVRGSAKQGGLGSKPKRSHRRGQNL